MIKVEYLNAFNFQAAVRGMRNPMNSWEKSDSLFYIMYDYRGGLNCMCAIVDYNRPDGSHWLPDADGYIGPNDFNLMKKLTKAGTEHRKFLRQIFVSMDITAPLYWWKEFDTYKVGTTANSCSTMHKIHSKEFTLDDFSHEHLYSEELEQLETVVVALNGMRQLYLDGRHKNDWWQMIQLLPSSYNQRRTISMNYENVLTILHQRSGHKLDEWNELCDIFRERLPLIKELEEAMK